MNAADIRLGPVTLQIGDLGRSLDFYRGVLGLELLTRNAGYAKLGAPDGPPLINLSEHPGARPVPRRGRLGLYHVALLLPERGALGAFLRRVGAAGVRVGTGSAGRGLARILTGLQMPDSRRVEAVAAVLSR